ncbi:MAG: type II toxin-antitoxin system HicA family toxin [Saprospiraceae bacterium]
MKRRDLIKVLIKQGCILVRHGAKHDIYHNPEKGTTQPIPRHIEINEFLAKKIIKDLTKDK